FLDSMGTLRVIDTATRRLLARPQAIPGVGPGDLQGGLSFSPDGARLAVGGTQPLILDAHTLRVRVRMPVMDGQVIFEPRFSPDGRPLAAFFPPSVARVALRSFDATSGRPLDTPRPIGRYSGALVLARDGRRVVTSREGGVTTVRDTRTLRMLNRLPA